MIWSISYGSSRWEEYLQSCESAILFEVSQSRSSRVKRLMAQKTALLPSYPPDQLQFSFLKDTEIRWSIWVTLANRSFSRSSPRCFFFSAQLLLLSPLEEPLTFGDSADGDWGGAFTGDLSVEDFVSFLLGFPPLGVDLLGAADWGAGDSEMARAFASFATEEKEKHL